MPSLSLGISTLLQGLYSTFWILIVLDIGSPMFSFRGLPTWTGLHLVLAVFVMVTAGAVVGVVMHTLSRNLFRRQKDLWAFKVLTSSAVRRRLTDVGANDTPLGGPTLEEIFDETNRARVRKAGEFVHALDYVVMHRAPTVHRAIQTYREQYRLARGFIIPSLAFAVVLPFWEPVRTVEGGGAVGPIPLFALQLSLIAVLVACVTFLAFRERAFRYAAARVMAYTTMPR